MNRTLFARSRLGDTLIDEDARGRLRTASGNRMGGE